MSLCPLLPLAAFGPVTLTGVLNDIAYEEPASPFLTQPGKSPHCNEDWKPGHCKGTKSCACSHLVEVPYGKDIDVIVVDGSDSECQCHSVSQRGYTGAHTHST